MKRLIALTALLLSALCGAAQIDTTEAPADTLPRVVIYAKTLPATDIRNNRATLNAEILETDTNLRSFYFEYKTGSVTKEVKAVRSQDRLSANVTDLYAGAEYTFSIVAKTATVKQTAKGLRFKTWPKPLAIKNEHSGRGNTIKGWAKGVFNLNNLTGTKKKLVNACNYKNAVVRSKAAAVAGQSSGVFNIGQICDIFDYCYNNWGYVNDPQSEEIYQTASSTINNGMNGDCDDFAIVTCSMLLAIGGEARINFAFTAAGGGHAFTEVNCGTTDMQKIAEYIAARYKSDWSGSIHYRVDQDKNCWLNLDWWAKHPGGKYYQADRGTRFYILDNYCEDF